MGAAVFQPGVVPSTSESTALLKQVANRLPSERAFAWGRGLLRRCTVPYQGSGAQASAALVQPGFGWRVAAMCWCAVPLEPVFSTFG